MGYSALIIEVATMETGSKKLNTVKTTLTHHLCIGCGLCAAICPEKAISLCWDKSLTYVPIVDEGCCSNCGLCVRICPNTPASISEYALAAAQQGERFGLPGAARYYIAYDLNPQNRIRSASGGALTAILTYLLESGEIDGVIASVPITALLGEPHYEIRLMRSTQEVDTARSSHYQTLCYEGALKELGDIQGRFALVGVPCVLRGANRLPKELRGKIRYTFGIACSKNATGQFLDCLAKQLGIRNEEVFTANQRDKIGIHGAENYNIYYKLTGREIRRNRFQIPWTDMWRNYFFTPECCLYCPDFYGVDADLSVKDAWGRWNTDPLGTSMLIVRHPELAAIVEKLRDDNILYLEPCSADDVFQSQYETPRFKHVEVRDRLAWKRVIGRELKQNGYPLGRSRRWWRKSSWHYWQLLGMARLSRFLYTRQGHISEGTTAKIIALAHPFSIILPYLYRKSGLLRVVSVTRFSFHLARNAIRRPLPEPIRQNDYLHVLISGGHGYHNTGDEAQLGANISRWRQMNPKAKITVLSPNTEYTEHTHGVSSERAPRIVFFNADKTADYDKSNFWFKWKFRINKPRLLLNARLTRNRLPTLFLLPHEARLLRLIQNSDVLHISGGGYLTGATLSRLWDNMLLIRMADLLGVPVILSGQTIGVFKSQENRRLARWGLQKAKLIYLRDPEESEAELASIGIKGKHVSSSFDDALFCDIADDEAVRACLKKSGIDTARPYAALSVWTDRQEVLKRIAGISDFITGRQGIQVLFIPTSPDDMHVIRNVQGYQVEKSCVLAYDYDYRLIKGAIGQAKFCLTMKHHPIVFAMSMDTPTISIAVNEYFFRKNLGALRLFGQGNYMIDEEALLAEGKAEETVRKLLGDITKIKNDIRLHLEKYRERDGEAIKRFLGEIT